MNIYLYDKNTLEYLRTEEAVQDPEETKLQGRFVPLVPRWATTMVPPECGKNEVPVFINNSWVVYPDYRENYYKVFDDLSVEKITKIGVQEDALIVHREIAEAIMQNPKRYRIEGDTVVQKSVEEIEAEEFADRKEQFEKDFFRTSLGWIRRKVTMKDGTVKDFLSDLLLQIKAGIEMGQTVFVITYNIPDFKVEITKEYLESLQDKKAVTLEFIKECLEQTVKDFGE